MAITIKTEKEIELLKAGGKRLALILDELAKMCITGVSGDELDKRAGYLMEKYSSRSAFFRYRPAPDSKPFPANICLSVNHVAVHGIPSKKIILREGDVVKVDAGLIYGGMIVDSAVTVVVGNTTAKVRRLIKQDFDRVFSKSAGNIDVILTPTTPSTAFKFGEKISDPLSMYLADIYTVSVNLAGVPAVSLPCGEVSGLPAGLQLIGKNFDDIKLLKIAKFAETLIKSHEI